MKWQDGVKKFIDEMGIDQNTSWADIKYFWHGFVMAIYREGKVNNHNRDAWFPKWRGIFNAGEKARLCAEMLSSRSKETRVMAWISNKVKSS